MRRLRNKQTGVIISVSGEKSERLGNEWVQADKAAPKPRKKAAPEKSEQSTDTE